MADKIGFIGVGTMGEPMCRNLAQKGGLQVLAADRDDAPLKRLAADGVKSASLEEIAESCRTIFLSLPGGKEVEQVCLGDRGLVSKAVLGWTVIDLSTSPIGLARRLHAEFEAGRRPSPTRRLRARARLRSTARSPSWSAARRNASRASSRCCATWRAK